MTTSAYIHIPFCKSKCKYCSFVSFTNCQEIEQYVPALLKDIQVNYRGELLKTLYLGGGTPSLLSLNILGQIVKSFSLDTNSEITIEVNPDDASLDYFKGLLDIGINRISMGSQSFDNNILKIIGRRHTSEQTKKAVEFAQSAGFKNVSLDLIYGLPEQNNIKTDLEMITQLGVQHISTYGLKIEEGSYFYNHLPKNLPDDDRQADMYLEINEYLAKKEFKRYEISNFAKVGYESQHNLNYWNNSEYYGFGLAAHGYVNGVRYSNLTNMADYIEQPIKKDFEHKVTKKEKLEEEIFLGFRKETGIDVREINKKFNIDFEILYKPVLTKFVPQYIEKTSKGYKLTLEGFLLSNNILSEFI
ncbi:MAG: radical SAM family heme chaperone HemW [Cyanobacteria bacterium SIG28]|nr:radical SAM family heme chaperone HemW [Cyanobacteria bacterium SIG28]